MSQTDASVAGLTEEAIALLDSHRQGLSKLSEAIDRKFETLAQKDTAEAQPHLVKLQRLQEETGRIETHTRALLNLLASDYPEKPPVGYAPSHIQLLQRQEEERARTAKTLEDTSAQLLANAIFELAAVKKLLTDKTNNYLAVVIDGLNALQTELEEGLTELRLLIADLEPNTVLGNFGLVAGLRRYLDKFQERTGLDTALVVQTQIDPLPGIIETAIFRVIQEALQNTQRHASATKVQVTIAEENSQLVFSILDNGIGLTPNLKTQEHRQLGLVSINEIAALLNGTLQIKSEKGKSTQVILTIPYPKF